MFVCFLRVYKMRQIAWGLRPAAHHRRRSLLRCSAAIQQPALASQQRPAPALSRSNWGSSSQGSELDRKLEAVLKDYQQAQGQKRAAAGAPGIN